MKNKKILIVGFGKSGEASLRYLLSQGARVAVTDIREKQYLEEALQKFKGHPIDWYLGGHTTEVFLSAESIVVSPGVPWNLKPLREARERGIPILNEMELALELLRSMEIKPKIIAVTGTNGKTTTVTLLHHLLKGAGKKSLLAGNVGRPLLDCVDEMKSAEFLVLEVSSYQLESTPSLKPDVAIWLNITEDHLDWHEGFEAYVKAKAKLIRQCAPEGLVIYNGEDAVVAQTVEQIPSPRLMFSAKRRLKLGGWVEEGRLVLKDHLQEEPFSFDLKSVPLKGIHNWENMLASLLALSPYINDKSLLQKGLESFLPLPHRMQVVRKLNGVTYINDSKGTNVGACLMAFADLRAPILWIAGGRDKGGGFEPLREWVKKKSRKAYLLGEARERMADCLKGWTDIVMVKDLKEAILLASQEGVAGETVLFSPACSSFDMFKDYVDRGNTFIRLVNELKGT